MSHRIYIKAQGFKDFHERDVIIHDANLSGITVKQFFCLRSFGKQGQ